MQVKRAFRDSLEAKPYIVGLFDWLGFGKRVYNTPLSSLIKDWQDLRLEIPNASRRASGRGPIWRIGQVVFSDTMLLWARPEPLESVLAFFAVCAGIVSRGVIKGWPIRGGIAVVWAPYEFWIDGETSHCGVDVFDFIKADGVWRVSNSMWTVEPNACAELRPEEAPIVRPAG